MERITLEQVYENPIFQALDPKGKQFLRARRLPTPMNPFAIDITALIAFGELPHIKVVPVVGMMLKDFKKGLYEGKHTIVVPSSGNTAHAVVRLARAFGFTNVKVVMSTDVPASKTGILRALASADVMQVGDVTGTAREEAQKHGHCLLDQYSHLGNVDAHWHHTGPEIMRALDGRGIGVIAIPMGSGGTVCGVGHFLKQKNPETIILGVRPALGEQVPGARDEEKMRKVVTLPWEKVVDRVIDVTRKQSFITMRSLWGWVEPQPGPTSGLAFAGLMQYLEQQDSIDRMRLGNAAIICPDSGYPYSDVILAELDTNQGF